MGFVFLFLAQNVQASEPFTCRVEPRFSSDGSIGQAVIEAIRQTKGRLLLALYGFDNAALADELVGLAKKKAEVRLKVDAGRSAGSKVSRILERLKAGGVQVQTVASDGRNHNKFVIIDGARVLTGSYNWTFKAESNWENLLLLDCPELAKRYEVEWEKIR
jgi:phosphatidylserine/phosphatidylglycerophosphate/cardiolipin synthase-like enzyme